jgi:putative transposase
MEMAQLKKLKDLKELEAELSQYKKIVAEQTLQITVLKDVIEDKL